MKTSFSLIPVVLIALWMTTTGFQCGSAELTTAKLAMQQQQWDKAEQSLLKEVAKNDKNEEAWFMLGQVRLEMKKYQEMNDAYAKALAVSDAHKPEIDRNRLAIWSLLYNDGIAAYNKEHDYPKAVEKFTLATTIVPDSASTYYVLGLSHYANRDNQKAKVALQSAIQRKANFDDALRLLGQIHIVDGQEKKKNDDQAGAAREFQQAVTAFEAAYAADPKTADNIMNLIEAYELTADNDKAMMLTRDAVASDPNNKLYRYAYGVFLLRKDSYEESIAQFVKALEIDPNDPDALYNCGVAYLNWGVAQKAESDKRAEQGKNATGKKEDTAYKDKFKAALPYLEKTADIRKDDAALWQNLGRLYANLNMVEKSRDAFTKADKITKGN